MSATPTPPAPAAPRRRRIGRLVIGGLGILLLAVGAWVLVNRDFVFHRIGVVKPGVLYRSAQLDAGKLEEVVDRYGIKTVVNLREEENAEEAATAAAHGVRYVWLPSTQVPPPATIDAFLALMDDPASQPVLVHCEHGVGRTGVLAGLYRLEYDRWSVEQTLSEARRYAFWGSYWEGQDKTRYLETYVPRAERPPQAEPAD